VGGGDPKKVGDVGDVGDLGDLGCQDGIVNISESQKWQSGRGATAPHVRGCWALDLVLGKE
jgi:hypothetical protein